ncbi:MAG TPA: dTMP kinase [Candidatus Paceibacterota bacterium]|nr:dTMP kinase [Candidatus Paceibacterota bacterium]
MTFIALEGIEGAGKSTQFQLLLKRSDEIFPGKEKVFTREPGGSPTAEAIRSFLFSTDGANLDPESQMDLFFAARRMHLAEVVVPALAAGKLVISDRFIGSSFAYQVHAGDPSLRELFDLRRRMIEPYMPTRSIVIDVPADVAKARVESRYGQAMNHFDEKPVEFYETLREGYEVFKAEIAPAQTVFIDGNRPVEEVFEDLVARIKETL